MTSMGSKHYENSQPRRSRRQYCKNLDSLSIPKKGAHQNIICNIEKNFQHKVAAEAYYKPYEQSQGDYFADNKRNFHGCVDMENSLEHSYNSCKYSKKNDKNHQKMSSSSDKNNWNSSLASTSASDSDANSSNSSTSSELSGFKIVQKGKVVHNEIEEELDSPSSYDSYAKIGLKLEDNCEKFAASVLTTGPNVNEISLPSFF